MCWVISAENQEDRGANMWVILDMPLTVSVKTASVDSWGFHRSPLGRSLDLRIAEISSSCEYCLWAETARGSLSQLFWVKLLMSLNRSLNTRLRPRRCPFLWICEEPVYALISKSKQRMRELRRKKCITPGQTKPKQMVPRAELGRAIFLQKG